VVGLRVFGSTEAFLWTEEHGMVGLGDLSGGDFYSNAEGVSADGSIVVGFSRSGSGREAFLWTQYDGMVGLGDLPGGVFDSVAFGISADRSTVVGFSNSDLGTEAFL
jgi:probable HAF family extracellular repeat protein